MNWVKCGAVLIGGASGAAFAILSIELFESKRPTTRVCSCMCDIWRYHVRCHLRWDTTECASLRNLIYRRIRPMTGGRNAN